MLKGVGMNLGGIHQVVESLLNVAREAGRAPSQALGYLILTLRFDQEGQCYLLRQLPYVHTIQEMSDD
jgi:hypothetical protein